MGNGSAWVLTGFLGPSRTERVPCRLVCTKQHDGSFCFTEKDKEEPELALPSAGVPEFE